MNHSQDELGSVLADDPPDDAAGSGADDIMSPEAIAAMLDETASGDGDAVESEPIEIMSPDDISAMLDEGDGLEFSGAGDDAEDDELEDLFSRHTEEESDDETFPAAKNVEGLLSNEEVDILGEVGNISMGAVATTMYSLLDRRVSITTPRVSVYEAKEVLSVYRIPFVVATIEYVEGIEGNNLLVLKIDDAALITDLLMGGDGMVEQPVELNEMHLSAMSEIMNQMMGASSTALSKLLRTTVNISPPRSSQIDAGFDVSSLLGDIEMVTKISFDMEIEGLLKSELIQLIPYELSREFAKKFMESGMGVPSNDAEYNGGSVPAPSVPTPEPLPQPPQPAPQPPPPPPPPQPAAPQPSIDYMPPAPQPAAQLPEQPMPDPAQPYPQIPYPYPQAPYPAYPQPPYPQMGTTPGRLVDVHPMQFQSFDAPGAPGEPKSIDLVYNIPLQVTVELGKTKKEISEILEFGTGTIVVLDKMAGDPVEIVVNGKLIARGEVVVIDENYGVRITDIISG